MISSLTKEIGERIREGIGYEVYTENVYQGTQKPCFFVKCENVEKKQLLGGRFFLRVGIKVELDTDSETKKYDTEKLTGMLFKIMNLVHVEDKVFHGRGTTGKWENDLFVIRSSYDVFIKEGNEVCGEEDIYLMESIEVKEA